MLSAALSTLLCTLGKRYKWPLLKTYALTLTETVCNLLYPSLTGIAVDGLMAHKPLLALPLAVFWLFHMVVGLTRHIYDSSVFTTIYGHMATELVARQRASGALDTHVIARVSLSRELIAFLENEVPAIARGSIALVGAIIMMAVYDPVVAGMACVVLMPIFIVSRWFSGLSLRFNGALNDRLEQEPAIVSTGHSKHIAKHFSRVRFWRMNISRAEAGTWSIIECAALLLTMGTLFRLTSRDHISAGAIYAVLAYVWSFYESIDDLPNIIQNVSRIRDISERIAEGTDGRDMAIE